MQSLILSFGPERLREPGPSGSPKPSSRTRLDVVTTLHRAPDLGDLEITVTPSVEVDIDTARRYADLGVHRLAVQPPGIDHAAMERLITTTGNQLIGRV